MQEARFPIVTDWRAATISEGDTVLRDLLLALRPGRLYLVPSCASM
jgi:hypothetical protein